MKEIILKAEGISKQYRLGLVGSGSLGDDLKRLWAKVRGKEDPFLKVGSVSDRSSTASSDYVWALQDINFEIKKGEILGIIGKNGAGKSTLLKILSRVTSPTTGSIKTKGRIASLLEVGTGMHPELTGRENIFLNGAILGMSKAEIVAKIDEIIDFSGCEMYIDTPVKRYSSGMRVRLGFAVAAFLEPDILVVDEVLAVGDAEFQKKAIGKMQDISNEGGRTVIFVSHDMNAISTLTNRLIVLKNGGVCFNGETDLGILEYLSQGMNNAFYRGDASTLSPKITKVDLITSLPGNAQQHGKPLSIDFEISLPHDMENMALSFQILDEFQVPILHSWMIDSESMIQRKKGLLHIRCHIASIKLYIGSFTVRVHLSNSKSKEKLDFIESTCNFTVEMLKTARADYNWVKGTCKYIEETEWTLV